MVKKVQFLLSLGTTLIRGSSKLCDGQSLSQSREGDAVLKAVLFFSDILSSSSENDNEIVGMMASCFAIVPHAQLQMHPLKECLTKQWSIGKSSVGRAQSSAQSEMVEQQELVTG